MRPLSHKFPNVYEDRRGIYTISLTGRNSFPEEKTQSFDGKVYRYWDPERSKISAAIVKGISQLGLRENLTILYLGAAHGYTPSFLSDMIVGGMIFALDSAPQVIRNLMFVANERNNLAPILADARIPDSFAKLVPKVDYVYQDIAQPDQTAIFLRNCDKFLKEGGFASIAVKARSVSIAKKPKQIFREVREELEKHMTVVDYRELDPFEKDHCLFICKSKA